MKLIFDCGSTKCSIIEQNKDGKVLNQVRINGFNPIMHSDIEEATYAHFSHLSHSFENVESLMYCGAGCINSDINAKVEAGLQRIFSSGEIKICSDLNFIGEVLGIKEKSIIGILGTGSNAGLWDGQNIVQSTPSGGYLLGDEGSAFSMGKKVLINYIRGNFQEKNQKILSKEISVPYDELISNIYSSNTPNQKIASYAVLLDKIEDPLKDKIITDSFSDYIENRIKPLKEDVEIIHLFGSVAYFNQPYLKPLLEKVNLRIGMISKEPLDLIK